MNTTNILNGVTLASQDEVTEHAENTAVHLTEEERTTWNAKANASQLDTKADASALTSHETNTTVHVSQEEKEKWNARTMKGVVAATQDGLDEHTENTTVHITEEERTAWNAKANYGFIRSEHDDSYILKLDYGVFGTYQGNYLFTVNGTAESQNGFGLLMTSTQSSICSSESTIIMSGAHPWSPSEGDIGGKIEVSPSSVTISIGSKNLTLNENNLQRLIDLLEA